MKHTVYITYCKFWFCFNIFNRNKIKELEKEKKELVGVFGKSGAGKSSLINAVLEEKDLLPTAQHEACTSVLIKVEANMDNSDDYKAEVEFLTKDVRG